MCIHCRHGQFTSVWIGVDAWHPYGFTKKFSIWKLVSDENVCNLLVISQEYLKQMGTHKGLWGNLIFSSLDIFSFFLKPHSLFLFLFLLPIHLSAYLYLLPCLPTFPPLGSLHPGGTVVQWGIFLMISTAHSLSAITNIH